MASEEYIRQLVDQICDGFKCPVNPPEDHAGRRLVFEDALKSIDNISCKGQFASGLLYTVKGDLDLNGSDLGGAVLNAAFRVAESRGLVVVRMAINTATWKKWRSLPRFSQFADDMGKDEGIVGHLWTADIMCDDVIKEGDFVLMAK